MDRQLYHIILVLSASLLISCSKENRCDCLKSTGKITSELREIPDINEVFLESNVELSIVQDTICKLEITAGSNLIGLIESEVIDNKLYLRNKNKCNWVRSYSVPVKARLHVRNLLHIDYTGIGDISTENTLKPQGKFFVNVWNGMGTVELDIECHESAIKFHTGPGDLKLKGATTHSYFYSNGYGTLRAENFVSVNCFVVNNNTADIYVNVTKKLTAEIQYIGNIMYYGKPVDISLKRTGTGNLIEL